jgi:hypothetical protein
VLCCPTDRVDFKALHFSPVLPNGWALAGEMAKWIPITSTRVRSITTSSDSDKPIAVRLAGVVDEKVSFGFVHVGSASASSELPIMYVSCVFGPTGEITITPTGCELQ